MSRQTVSTRELDALVHDFNRYFRAAASVLEHGDRSAKGRLRARIAQHMKSLPPEILTSLRESLADSKPRSRRPVPASG